MAAEHPEPPRVLLCNLTPMARLGMARVLADGGLDVLPDHGRTDRLMRQVGALRPDVVVLGVDDDRGRELGARVRRATPHSKVIFWAGDEDEMTVFDPGAAVPRRIAPPVAAALVREAGRDQRTTEGE